MKSADDSNPINETEIKVVIFENSTIYNIPKEIFETFPNTDRLEIVNQNVQEIKSCFCKAKSLRKFAFSHNDVSYLMEKLFSGASSLETLYLPNNGIVSIDETAFRDLTLLNKLTLKNNDIKFVNENTFEDLSNLELLDLQNNSLETINMNLLRNNLNLKEIFLQENQIKSIILTIFRPLKFLEKLFLSKNICINFDYQNNMALALEIEIMLRNCSIEYIIENENRFEGILDHFKLDFVETFLAIDHQILTLNGIIEIINQKLKGMQVHEAAEMEMVSYAFVLLTVCLTCFLMYTCVSGYKIQRQINYRHHIGCQ
jgi:Leucine-rich repeat (LRR) protein